MEKLDNPVYETFIDALDDLIPRGWTKNNIKAAISNGLITVKEITLEKDKKN